jgi:hypothetical protein
MDLLTGVKATAAHLAITQGSVLVFCRDYTLGGSATGKAC